jgi:hypothetical protein
VGGERERPPPAAIEHATYTGSHQRGVLAAVAAAANTHEVILVGGQGKGEGSSDTEGEGGMQMLMAALGAESGSSSRASCVTAFPLVRRTPSS